MLELRLWFVVACPAAGPALIGGGVTSAYGEVGGGMGAWYVWYIVCVRVHVRAWVNDHSTRIAHNRYTEIAGMYATTKSTQGLDTDCP